MPNHAPPPDQDWDLFRRLWELFLLILALHKALDQLARALASHIGRGLQRALDKALAEVFSEGLGWACALVVLAPLGAILGYRAARWLLRTARKSAFAQASLSGPRNQ